MIFVREYKTIKMAYVIKFVYLLNLTSLDLVLHKLIESKFHQPKHSLINSNIIKYKSEAVEFQRK